VGGEHPVAVEVRARCSDTRGTGCGAVVTLDAEWLEVLRQAVAESLSGWEPGPQRDDRQDLVGVLGVRDVPAVLRRPPRSAGGGQGPQSGRNTTT
jgi:hypothetical protein